MRTFTLATMAAVASASRVHDFFAENNYICELCKTAVDYAGKGRDIELENLYEQFPKLGERIGAFANQAELVNFAEPEASC